jgi:hypothetical protein
MSTPRNAEDLMRDPDEIGKPDPTDAFLDTPVSTTDPKALRQKGVADKVIEIKLENAVRAIIATPGGPMFLAHVITRMCGGDNPHFHPSNSIMSEIAGRRSVGWQIESMIRDIDYELWITVDREIEKLRPKPKTQAQKNR